MHLLLRWRLLWRYRLLLELSLGNQRTVDRLDHEADYFHLEGKTDLSLKTAEWSAVLALKRLQLLSNV